MTKCITKVFASIFEENPGLLQYVQSEFAPSVQGRMNDASKRRFDAVEPIPSAESSPRSSNWSVLGTAHGQSVEPFHILRVTMPGVQIKEDYAVPLPNDVKDLNDGSTTFLKLKKLRDGAILQCDFSGRARYRGEEVPQLDFEDLW